MIKSSFKLISIGLFFVLISIEAFPLICPKEDLVFNQTQTIETLVIDFIKQEVSVSLYSLEEIFKFVQECEKNLLYQPVSKESGVTFKVCIERYIERLLKRFDLLADFPMPVFSEISTQLLEGALAIDKIIRKIYHDPAEVCDAFYILLLDARNLRIKIKRR